MTYYVSRKRKEAKNFCKLMLRYFVCMDLIISYTLCLPANFIVVYVFETKVLVLVRVLGTKVLVLVFDL